MYGNCSKIKSELLSGELEGVATIELCGVM